MGEPEGAGRSFSAMTSSGSGGVLDFLGVDAGVELVGVELASVEVLGAEVVDTVGELEVGSGENSCAAGGSSWSEVEALMARSGSEAAMESKLGEDSRSGDPPGSGDDPKSCGGGKSSINTSPDNPGDFLVR
jgi:hypothetical protein